MPIAFAVAMQQSPSSVSRKGSQDLVPSGSQSYVDTSGVRGGGEGVDVAYGTVVMEVVVD